MSVTDKDIERITGMTAEEIYMQDGEDAAKNAIT
mgnify:CR=1 FL=1